MRERGEVERLEAERRRTLAEMARVAELRAEVALERARLQAALAIAVAERGAERQRLIAQRAGLRAEVDHLRRGQTHAIYQFALELAVAVGGG
jgi:hypothetical protein